jgi:DNA-binding NarL/FixJ family response regulator
VQATLGDHTTGLRTLRRARDVALRAGNDEAVSRAWNNIAWLLEGEACVCESLAAVEWDERAGLGPDAGVGTLTITATALFQLGRWQEADRVLDRGLAVAREASARMSLRLCRARLALGRGYLADVEAILEEDGPVAAAHHDSSWRILASELEAQLWLMRMQPDHASIAIQPAVDAFDALPVRSATVQSETMAIALRAEADRAHDARSHGDRVGLAAARSQGAGILRRARDVAAEVQRHGRTGPRRPAALAALCAAEWTRLEGASDPSAWEAAGDACRAAEQVHLVVYARYRQAEAILDTARDRVAAAPVLLIAHQDAARMGALPIASAIAALASRAGINLDPAGPGPADPHHHGCRRPVSGTSAFGLTPREQQVLALVADGRTNREIAGTLFITEGTAAIHVSRVLGKLGVARRTEAAAVAHRLHLVDAPASPAGHVRRQ